MSVAASHGTLLGLIVVLDPDATLEPSDKKDPESDARPGSPRAGALHAIGLATGALSLHLLHRRHLASTELRLRHDLVETVLLEPAGRPRSRDRPPGRTRIGPQPRPHRSPPRAGPPAPPRALARRRGRRRPRRTGRARPRHALPGHPARPDRRPRVRHPRRVARRQRVRRRPWSNRADNGDQRGDDRSGPRPRHPERPGRSSTTPSPTSCATPPPSGSAASSNAPSTSPAPTARPCRPSPSACARPTPEA